MINTVWSKVDKALYIGAVTCQVGDIVNVIFNAPGKIVIQRYHMITRHVCQTLTQMTADKSRTTRYQYLCHIQSVSQPSSYNYATV